MNNKEEKSIHNSLESGKWQSVKNLAKEKKRLEQTARNTMLRDRNMKPAKPRLTNKPPKKTTSVINVNKELLAKAKKLSGRKNTGKIVELALEDWIKRLNKLSILELRGKIHIENTR